MLLHALHRHFGCSDDCWRTGGAEETGSLGSTKIGGFQGWLASELLRNPNAHHHATAQPKKTHDFFKVSRKLSKSAQ